MAIDLGKKAPAFTLKNEDNDKVALADLRGQWVVVYFYPRDDTPGCTTEACEFTSTIRIFDKLGAKVLGVSPDDCETHKKFALKHGLKVGLLSDPDKKVMTKYEAWGEKNMYGKKTVGVIRSTVLIDPQGKIAHHWRRVKAKGHAEQVRRRLEELQTG
ncbi:MAG: peroxiredoxin [Proteobacteria bacterium]|nr:peroxiredoxin [Pseudomonadota bacterium]